MSNLLKNITNSLLEAEDDLFPGLTPSAFDEHNKIMTKRPKLEELERVDSALERFDTIIKASEDEISRLKTRLRKTDLFLPNWSTIPGLVEYNSIPDIATKFPAAAKALNQHGYNPSTVATSDVQNTLVEVERVHQRRIQIKHKVGKLRAKATRLRKGASGSEIDRQKAENPIGTVPENKIPKQIRAVYFGDQYMKHGGEWKTEDLTNPYFEGKSNTTTTEKYAGHPAHFNWQKREITQYLMISNLVKYLGLPELNILYLKRIEHDKSKKEMVAYYMANSDKSFQFTRSMWGSNVIYTKDTRVNNYNSNFNISFIIDAKKEIAETVTALKKFKGKKP